LSLQPSLIAFNWDRRQIGSTGDRAIGPSQLQTALPLNFDRPITRSPDHAML
jgi:hypothetical protein